MVQTIKNAAFRAAFRSAIANEILKFLGRVLLQEYFYGESI